MKTVFTLSIFVLVCCLSGCGEALGFTYTINAGKCTQENIREVDTAFKTLAKEEDFRVWTYNADSVTYIGNKKPVVLTLRRTHPEVYLMQQSEDRNESDVTKRLRLRAEAILKRVVGEDGFTKKRMLVKKSPLA